VVKEPTATPLSVDAPEGKMKIKEQTLRLKFPFGQTFGLALLLFALLFGVAEVLTRTQLFKSYVVAPPDGWVVGESENYASLMNRRNQVQAISLGNSHSDAIDFTVFGLEGQRLARGGADLFEVERYAAAVSGKLPSLQIAFVALSYYSFSRDNSTLDNMRDLRVELYATLPIWLPAKGDGHNFLVGKLQAYSQLMKVVQSGNWYNVIHRIFESAPPEDLSQSDPQYTGVRTLTPWGECAHFTVEELNAHGDEIAGKNVTSSRAMAKAHPRLPDDALEALAQTIEHFQAKGVRVILFTPPYYEAYTAHFSDQAADMIDQMRQAASLLQEKYHVEYFDFSNDPDIIRRPELFFNSDHVNNCGRKAFTEHLLRAMSETGDNSSKE
jgi:hypothetical protein